MAEDFVVPVARATTVPVTTPRPASADATTISRRIAPFGVLNLRMLAPSSFAASPCPSMGTARRKATCAAACDGTDYGVAGFRRVEARDRRPTTGARSGEDRWSSAWRDRRHTARSATTRAGWIRLRR